ncbi:MAG TPA: hypothetical protein ENJ38_12585 [Rhodospirillales bacterium]|nr:hypothetical protein [Rhodospirillales bacterium]
MERRKSDSRNPPVRLRLLVLPALVLALAGCGRRGPLRLPEAEPPRNTPEGTNGDAEKDGR